MTYPAALRGEPLVADQQVQNGFSWAESAALETLRSVLSAAELLKSHVGAGFLVFVTLS